jgi:hypothetical protein
MLHVSIARALRVSTWFGMNNGSHSNRVSQLYIKWAMQVAQSCNNQQKTERGELILQQGRMILRQVCVVHLQAEIAAHTLIRDVSTTNHT